MSKKENEDKGGEIEKLEAEKAELIADLQRTRADFENYRKQVEAQREAAVKAGRFLTVGKLLPVLDDLGRAVASYEELSPMKKSMEKVLGELGLSVIDTAEGAEFNPDLMEAVMVEGEGEHEVVAETLREGYYYEGEVLRAAMVKVVKK